MSTHSGYVTLMIITDTGDSPKSIKFSRTTFRIILALLGLFVVAITVAMVSYGTLLSHSLERAKLSTEVDQLKRYSAKVDTLERNLATYRTMLKKMTDLAGIDLGEFGINNVESPTSAQKEEQVSPSRNYGSDESVAHPIPHGYPVKGYISRSFRPSEDNPHMRHYGVDLAVSVGTPVIATADGVVTFAAWDSTFGYKVILTHAENVETIYGHNDSLTVQVGDEVKFGQTIAVSGNTGISTAPHVHYEIRKNGISVNPDEFIDKKK
jgi:murein DD-endopeptidase MepM/ murein hydrolase activator NlpD